MIGQLKMSCLNRNFVYSYLRADIENKSDLGLFQDIILVVGAIKGGGEIKIDFPDSCVSESLEPENRDLMVRSWNNIGNGTSNYDVWDTYDDACNGRTHKTYMRSNELETVLIQVWHKLPIEYIPDGFTETEEDVAFNNLNLTSLNY